MRVASALLVAALVVGLAFCVPEDAGAGATPHMTAGSPCLAMAAPSLSVDVLTRPSVTGWVSDPLPAHVPFVALRTPDPPPKFRSLA